MLKKISIMVIDWPKISHSGLSEPRTTSMGAYRAESGRDSRLRSSRSQHVMRKMTEDPFVIFWGCGEGVETPQDSYDVPTLPRLHKKTTAIPKKISPRTLTQ